MLLGWLICLLNLAGYAHALFQAEDEVVSVVPQTPELCTVPFCITVASLNPVGYGVHQS
jgi:hypothetical protein